MMTSDYTIKVVNAILVCYVLGSETIEFYVILKNQNGFGIARNIVAEAWQSYDNEPHTESIQEYVSAALTVHGIEHSIVQ